MKAEILKILHMQAQGKLTQDQAAELLAVLADQAREQTQSPPPPPTPPNHPPTPAEGPSETQAAPGTRGGANTERSFSAHSAAAIHGLVDTAIGVGATIGRAASVIGGEVASMVHRDEGGNSVTLSKVDAPEGEDYDFNGNTINVSKVAHITLHGAQVRGNTVNASKLAGLAITRGRFAQCNVSGSSLSQVTITGPEAPVSPEAPAAGPIAAGIRGVTFNASKFARVRLTGASALEVSTIQAAAIKDWELTGSTIRDSKINDASVGGLELAQAALTGLVVERAQVQRLKVRGAALRDVKLSGVKVNDLTIAGGTWNEVKLRREGAGVGGCECSLIESVIENCDLTGCEFIGCTFRRTTLRNLKPTGITVRNADFTGLTLDTEEAFRKAAGV